MPKIIFSNRANTDILDIWLWIAAESSISVADTVVERIQSRISTLERHPYLGVERTEIASGARSLIIDRWLVLYHVPDDVQIVRIVDGVRSLGQIWSV